MDVLNVQIYIWLTGEPGSGLGEWAAAQKWDEWAAAKKWAEKWWEWAYVWHHRTFTSSAPQHRASPAAQQCSKATRLAVIE